MLKLFAERRNLKQPQDEARISEINSEISALQRLQRRLFERSERVEASFHDAIVRFLHCQATLCAATPDFAPNTSTAIDAADFSDPRRLFHDNRYFFVSTFCTGCRQRAKEINDWVLDQYEDWLLDAFMIQFNRHKAESLQVSDANRFRFLEFLNDLATQIEALRECERLACPDTHGPIDDDAYLQQGLAPDQCLDDADARSAVTEGRADALPSACTDSWLERWLLDCDASCFRIDDVAVQENTPAAAACSGDGTPIAGFLADLGIDQWFAHAAPACGFSPAAGVDGAEAGRARFLLAPVSGTPNDRYYQSDSLIVPGLPDQWGVHRVDPLGVLDEPDNLVNAHATIVAIIDSGVDIHHPDLNGAIWRNGGEIPANGVDDDRNGFIDDVSGWNFVQDDNNVEDRNGHGTLVAGIVAATINNRIGIAGVNPWARVLPIKVMNFLGNGNSVDIAAAITYAVDEGARVINVSLGGDEFSEAERHAIRYADAKGALVVVAAGNESADAAQFWPAGLDNVITVAAVEPDDRRARYSNWGSPVDIAAPGSDILSLRARHTDLMYLVDDDYAPSRNVVGEDRELYYASGTSFAAPFVSGAASLIFSLRPELNAAQVRRMLLNAARDIESPGIDSLTGFGLLDTRAALAANPEYYVDAAIMRVTGTRRDGKALVQVYGTTDANQFASAELQYGAGALPQDWKVATDSVVAPVQGGLLGEIDVAELRNSAAWTLRLITTHQDGSRRESRFTLNLQ